MMRNPYETRFDLLWKLILYNLFLFTWAVKYETEHQLLSHLTNWFSSSTDTHEMLMNGMRTDKC